MNHKISGLLLAGVLLYSGSVFAQVVRFNAVGEANVSGYVVFEMSGATYGGCDPNTAVVNLDLTVTAGGGTETFALGDVVTTDDTQFSGSANDPGINNGCGDLATKGDWTIGFWPDGNDGSPIDGDASLRVEIGDVTDVSYAVQWVAAPIEAEPVPTLGQWGAMLLLLLMGGLAVRHVRANRVS